jgi:hypothetical protein
MPPLGMTPLYGSPSPPCRCHEKNGVVILVSNSAILEDLKIDSHLAEKSIPSIDKDAV